MAAKNRVKRHRVRVARRKGAKPRKMTLVWCLVGLIICGLLLVLMQAGEEKTQRPRRVLPKPKPEKIVIPEVETPPAPVPTPEPAPQPEPEEDNAPEPTVEPEPEPDTSSPDEPEPDTSGVPPKLPELPEEKEEPEKGGKSRLDATDEQGNKYIDMATGTLLFTDSSDLNDENLKIYLDAVYEETQSERYDDEAAERPDENKQVK